MKVFMFILVFYGGGDHGSYRVEYPSLAACQTSIKTSNMTQESDASIVVYCAMGKTEVINPITGKWMINGKEG